MIGIFGAGFGLYGYLPALIEVGGGPILLLDRYRIPFSERTELRRFVSAVQWQENEESD